jgi:hypothetical protein
MDRDPIDFAPNAAADDEVERPQGGEDDPALMAPVLEALKTVQDPEILSISSSSASSTS